MSKPTLLERVQQILDDHDEACLMTEGCYGLTSGAADEIVALLAEHDRQAREEAAPTCPCGKPLSHLDADPDSQEWACRMPPSVR